jgi:hypothetical protein
VGGAEIAGRECTDCGATRPLEDFSWRDADEMRRRWQCRACCLERSRRHYADARAAYLERNRRNNPRQRQAAQNHVYEYLREHPCIACGEPDIVILEFNHRDPLAKLANISDMIQRKCSIGRIDAEIAKCDVLCVNCHQRLTSLARTSHYKRRLTPPTGSSITPRQAANLRNYQLILTHLAQAACLDCGQTDPFVLQFDHRERKANHVSWLVGSGCSARRLTDELAKCDIRCANCHRRRTAHAGQWLRTRSSSDPADNPPKLAERGLEAR